MADGGGSKRKLTVEICNARNLMPKDGQGTASAYVIVDFDGQRRRTTTRLRDLNPQWDEKLEFLVHDPESMASETMEINVYNDKKTGKRSTFLGKVRISGGSFCKEGSEGLVYYPLEKRSVFSQIKGEIGVKVWYVDEEEKKEEKKEEVKEEKKEEGEKKEDEEKPEAGNDKAAAPSKPAEEEKKPEENNNSNNKKKKKQDEKKGEDKAKASEKTPEKPKKENKEENTPKKENNKKTTIALLPEAVMAVSSPAKVSTTRTSDLDVRSQWGDRSGNSHDLIERIPYLFVRLLKAKVSDSDASVYAKVSIGTHSVKTRTLKNNSDWDQVFAFHKASLNSTALDVSVWAEKKKPKKSDSKEESADTTTVVAADSCLGVVSFDLQEIPKRSPPDSALAPQWYTLEGDNSSAENDVMVATWVGTQVDEAFQEAWQSDSGGYNPHTRSKAYLSPKLWYLRLTVIQTQDLRFASPPPAGSSSRDLSVKAQLGPQIFRTAKPLQAATTGNSAYNSSWNEDLVFVAAEPFDPFLVITVEDNGNAVGHAKVHVSSIHRVDDKSEPPSRWFNLAGSDANNPYGGRIHVRVCLEGGYHVLDEAAHVTSDVRAASKQLSKPPIGLLEVGIRGATNLLPIKTPPSTDHAGGTTDAYVVLKYGPKWARTRTLVDQFNPRWNEQYAWDVFDPCTVLTVGVFDNGKTLDKPEKDVRIGKVRIRLSTLDTNRVYLNSYPLTLVQPSGPKKTGELELSIRFTCPSYLTLIQSYTSPLLPRMHYLRPLAPAQQDLLRHTAMRIVSSRLSRSEPPLGPEVVHFMLDTDAHSWSLRRSKANWFRVVNCLSFAIATAKWVHSVRTWKNPTTTILVHLLLAAVVFCPNLILPTLFMYLVLILTWRYPARPRSALVSMDPRLSCVELVGPDELDEEFDTYPTIKSETQVKARYDRLRALAGRAQVLLGDVAAQGERVEALMSWRDPRATGIFVGFCVLAAVVFYVVPFEVLALVGGFYYLRHPRFRGDLPPLPLSFFRRLPSLSDRIL